MKKFKKILLLGSVIFLVGCVGMNGEFDCNVSSGGKCLPTDQVNKMVDAGAFNR